MGHNGLDLDLLKQMADHQQQQQLAINAAVQEAISNPYRVTTIQVCALSYQPETGVLMIGCPGGERIDIALVEQARIVLRGQLGGEE